MERKLAELEHRRDALLGEMDENASHLSHYLRVHYAPRSILRRHIGPAMGVAAAIGTLVAGVKAPRNGLLHALWSRMMPSQGNGKETAVSAADRNTSGKEPPVSSSGPMNPATGTGHHTLMDVAEPIVRTLIVGVAQAVPWRNLVGRILQKREKHVNGHDSSHSAQD
jgi:hypothetical protein